MVILKGMLSLNDPRWAINSCCSWRWKLGWIWNFYYHGILSLASEWLNSAFIFLSWQCFFFLQLLLYLLYRFCCIVNSFQLWNLISPILPSTLVEKSCLQVSTKVFHSIPWEHCREILRILLMKFLVGPPFFCFGQVGRGLKFQCHLHRIEWATPYIILQVDGS